MNSTAYDQRLAVRLAKLLARTPATPNMVTTFGVLCGLCATILFAQGVPALSHIAALVFMYAVFNDHVDGELARMTERTSRFGHYYDHFAASTTYIGMFVGIGIGLSGGELGSRALALGIAAGISVTLIFLLRMDIEVRGDKDAVVQKSFAGFEIEDTLYLVGPITWLGFLEPFLIAAGIGTPLFLLWVLWDWRRQIARARRQRERA